GGRRSEPLEEARDRARSDRCPEKFGPEKRHRRPARGSSRRWKARARCVRTRPGHRARRARLSSRPSYRVESLRQRDVVVERKLFRAHPRIFAEGRELALDAAPVGGGGERV